MSTPTNPSYCGNHPELDHTGCPSSVECSHASQLMPSQTQLMPSQLNRDEQQRLRQSMWAMPYASMVVSLRPAVDVDVDMVVRFLDELADVLHDVSAAHERDQAQLYTLEAQQRAVRAFLGLDDEGGE